MSVQRRDFLLLAALAAGTAMPAWAQTVMPAAGPSGTQATASTPDFSGVWHRWLRPGFGPPASGPGPVTSGHEQVADRRREQLQPTLPIRFVANTMRR